MVREPGKGEMFLEQHWKFNSKPAPVPAQNPGLQPVKHICILLSPLLVHSTEYEEVEKEASFILGLLAVKPEYQTKIAEQNALAGLVRLLNQYNVKAPKDSQPSRAGSARRAADAITNLAHENVEIKNMVRVVSESTMLVCFYSHAFRSHSMIGGN
eukprot:338757-Pelagomonas_calceolata.AAC.2